MVSTYTPRGRLNKQGTNDNPTTWGQKLNDEVIELIDQQIDGVISVDITGSTDKTLTTANGATDQARYKVIVLTGAISTNINVIIPNVQKVYFFKASHTGGTVTVKPTGATNTITLTNGQRKICYTDGTDIFEMVQDIDLTPYMQKANSLSDLANFITARANLSIAQTTISTSVDYTAVLADRTKTILVDASVGNRVITLTSAVTLLDGWTVNIKKVDSTSNTVTIQGPQNIDGVASKVLTVQNHAVGIISNGTAFSITRDYYPPAMTAVQPFANASIRVGTVNGAGTTNTFIRRFTTVLSTTGSDITYADSATLGTTFTINTTGVYAITYNDQFTTTNTSFGISLNSTQLTTPIGSITAANRLAISEQVNNASPQCCSVTVVLTAGDVIRPHLQSSSSNGTPALSSFTITRVK